MARTGYDAHETSLLWWGYATRGKGPGAYQWFEGLGDYVEIMYSRDTQKPLPWIFQRFRDEYLGSDFSQEPPYDELTGRTPQKFVHGKYPWLMQVLHQQMGDKPFRRCLQTLFRQYRYQAFTMDEFVLVFAREDPAVVQRWRKDWLDRRGIPEVKLSYSAERDSSRTIPMWTTRGTLEQSGELTGLPLDVGFQSRRGTTLQTITPSERVVRFERTGPESESIILDPGQKYLLKITDLSTAGAP
jgi:hypothetical protein